MGLKASILGNKASILGSHPLKSYKSPPHLAPFFDPWLLKTSILGTKSENNGEFSLVNSLNC